MIQSGLSRLGRGELDVTLDFERDRSSAISATGTKAMSASCGAWARQGKTDQAGGSFVQDAGPIWNR